MLFDTQQKPYRQSILLMENFQTANKAGPTLLAIHSPYGKLSNWQVKQARSHALRVTTVTVKETCSLRRMNRNAPTLFPDFFKFINFAYHFS